jgi:Tfp pilus assembly protein PilF
MLRVILVGVLALITAGCATTAAPKLDSTVRDRIAADKFYDAADCAQALPLYLKINETLNGDKHSLLRAGNCYAIDGQLDKAEQHFKSALEIDPSFAKAWNNLFLIQSRELLQTNTQMAKYLNANAEFERRTLEFSERMMTLIREHNQNMQQKQGPVER